jgi:hypothetical protein
MQDPEKARRRRMARGRRNSQKTLLIGFDFVKTGR